MTKTPDECQTMTQLRAEIDELDSALISLLAKRCQYIDRATDLKRIEGLPPRTKDRVTDVLALVNEKALSTGLDAKLATQLWSTLIDWGIDYEARKLGIAEDEVATE